MKTSLLKISRIAATTAVIALTFGSAAFAQSNDVNAMYDSNSKKPLGGLFAKGFTRTFTLMGGWNFASADLPAGIPGVGTNPGTALMPGEPTSLIFPPDNPETKDTGFAISGAMGRRHSRSLRSEIEFAIRENELSRNVPGVIATDLSADVRAYSLMKNVIFELPNQTRFTPYGGAGIGISWVDVDAQSTTFGNTTTAREVSEDDTALTYQAIGGVSTRVNQAMDFVVEYRFIGTGDIELDSIGSLPYQANNLFLGVKLEY